MEPENKTPSPVEEIRKSMAELKDAVKTLGEKGQLTDQVLERVKAVEEDLKSMEKKTLERQLSVKGVDEGKEKFDLHMAVKALRLKDWSEAGYEGEVIKATHAKAAELGYHPESVNLYKKDVLAGTGSSGGFLLPVEVDSGIIPLAIAERPVLNDMGITKLTNLAVGEYHIQKQTGRGTGYWIGELQAPTKSSQTFDRRTLRMRKVAAYSAASNDMLRQGRGTMDGFLRQDLADALGLAIETAALRGSGSDYQPKGVVNYSGLTSTTALGATGAQFGFRDAARMINSIEVANLLKGNLGFVTHPRVMLGLQIQGAQGYSNQTTNTQPISNGMPILTKALLDERLGYKLRTSTLLPITLTKSTSTDCTYVVFGDWKQLIMGTWGGLEIKVSDVASDGTNNMFVQDGFFVHALQTCDFTIRDEAAFTVISDARTTTIGETV